MTRVLDAASQDQLARARALLADLRDALTRFGASSDDLQVLAGSIRQLDGMFLLVVVGEFNAGKSAFINALVGARVLEEGVTPTTARIHLLEYGPEVSTRTEDEGVVVVTAPHDLLRDVHIVDTPGTNAIIREHERLTTDFVPRSDFVLFVTSAERPFTETERAFLEVIRAWGKKTLIVVNKVDILERPYDLEQVLTYVRDAARRLLGEPPQVFPVSARLALRAKTGALGSPNGTAGEVWQSTGFDRLESFIHESLDERTRFALKLANPLGVGEALSTRYAAIADERVALLQEDLELLGAIERQLAVYADDLARGFEIRMAAVEKPLLEMETRSHQYFEDTIRIGRVMDLVNRARIQKEFEERVVAAAPREIERRVTELIDWLIDQDLRQWESVTRSVQQRSHQHAAALGSPEIGSFHADRAALIESLGREAQRVVDTYDHRREAQTIADQARNAVAAAAAAGGAAVGLGTLVSVAATTAAADITGILMASVLAAIGFLVIPARRRRAAAAMREKMTELRARLTQAMRAEFERAVERSVTRIEGAVSPYSRFVRAEDQRFREAHDTLSRLGGQAAAFRTQLGLLSAAHGPQPR